MSLGRRHILKEVAFTPFVKNDTKYYNWGFGDVTHDKVSSTFRVVDNLASNNGDARLVINTVVSTLTLFFKIHPTAIVRLEAADEKRLRVYNGIIRRHLLEIETLYHVEPQIDGAILISKK